MTLLLLSIPIWSTTVGAIVVGTFGNTGSSTLSPSPPFILLLLRFVSENNSLLLFTSFVFPIFVQAIYYINKSNKI